MSLPNVPLCSPEELDLIEPQHTVHIAVHVQNYFFNPNSPRPSEERRQPLADATAQRIGAVSSWLSDIEIPTFWVCMDNEDISEEASALYMAQPGPNDKTIKADQCSAIQSGNMLELLQLYATKTLLISGGYASICVTDTVQDALEHGFQVFVMRDCLLDNQDDMDLRGMFSGYSASNKARFTTSAAVLERLGLEIPGAPAPLPPFMAGRSFV